MAESLPILMGLIALALIFDYINGMHDSANAIATVVSTRVLSPRIALAMAAVLNFGGAFISTAVAKTIGKGIVDPHLVTNGIVAASILSAILWNLLTWFYGIPSSSSHALIGGIIGAVISRYGFGTLNGEGVWKIVKSLLLSPLAGFAGGLILMIAIMWLFHKSPAGKVNRWFKHLQLVSAGFMAFSHGSNDAQKAMGVITMALVGMGYVHGGKEFHVPTWVVFLCASAMALGTAAGGWRIIKTMGVKMIRLQPVHGFAAEAAASITILTATHLGLPVSTTHVISSAIMGVGSAKRASAVRWEIAGQMGIAWVLTIPCTALVAFAIGWGFRLLDG
ncbi:MAG TPA: inorganic phosphate transporter [Fibrobacteria bacterium]|nr:inorganic phosphate transporter [Fibrobacteria bacterium]